MSSRTQAVLDSLSLEVPSWLRAPEWDDEGIVLSTRVRVARNLEGFSFPHHAELSEQEEVLRRIEQALPAAPPLAEARRLPIQELSDGERQFLVERHLISPAHAAGSGPRTVFVTEGERITLMVNEEDHLRLQAVLGGLTSAEAWSAIDPLDHGLGDRLRYAFGPQIGYLTACPTNLGTGLRVSVLLHLPALVLTQETGEVLRSAAQAGMLVRGLHGEGSSIYGNIFQISNRQTLGRSESDILGSVQRVARQVMEHERAARRTLLKEARLQVEDRIHRAEGVLRSARVLGLQEGLNLFSAVRLGVNMYVLSDVRINKLNELMVQIQPSHLERREGRALSPGEAEILRARLVRMTLSGPGGGTEPNE